MDYNLITAIATSITAIAALTAPIAVTWLTNKNRRYELAYKNKCEAISKFSSAYAKLYENSSLDDYWVFLSASYETLAFAHKAHTKKQISSLVEMIKKSNGETDDTSDALFAEIMASISESL